MEKRYQLSQRQFDSIAEAEKAVDAAHAAYQAALRHATMIGELIKDFHGVPDDIKAQTVDPKTQELVVVIPDPIPSS